MIETVLLEDGCFYHIYNRGNNKEDIFFEDVNYAYFLLLLKRYILPIADIYAYCLLRNHFHLLIRIKDETLYSPKQSFSNLFNAYAKALNKNYNRSGKLFSERFKKKKVVEDSYLTEIVFYLHTNPQKHKLVTDFRKYRYSSYQTILSDKNTDLKRDEIIAWFGSKQMFEKYHDDRYLAIHESLYLDDLEL